MCVVIPILYSVLNLNYRSKLLHQASTLAGLSSDSGPSARSPLGLNGSLLTESQLVTSADVNKVSCRKQLQQLAQLYSLCISGKRWNVMTVNIFKVILIRDTDENSNWYKWPQTKCLGKTTMFNYLCMSPHNSKADGKANVVLGTWTIIGACQWNPNSRILFSLSSCCPILFVFLCICWASRRRRDCSLQISGNFLERFHSGNNMKYGWGAYR